MKIEQLYTGCLSQGAYYIESKGEVAIIDPLREVKTYIDKAAKNNSIIKYIFETHFHADFVSGHLCLAEETGATIVYGPNAITSFDSLIAKDYQEFKLGEITIVALHTPGHTMESTTYLLRDKNNRDVAIFSGDTLFLGDVGRPDLAQKSGELTANDLAGYLYDSLREKIIPLSDDVIVYPAHGSGSACGKNMMKETIDTLGNQKKVNYALRSDMTKEEFIKEVTEGLSPPPKYFPLNVKMNQEGYKNINEIIKNGTTLYDPNEFEIIANQSDALILDVRNQDDFSKGHIPSSIFIGLDGSFAPWVGALVGDVTQPILLVVPNGREEEAVTRLSRVGFDNTLGILKGSFDSWKHYGKEFDVVDSISAEEFKKRNVENLNIFDVRKESEYKSEKIVHARNTPLNKINDYLSSFSKTNTDLYIYCAGGYRSMIAISILKSRGVHNLINIEGGFKAIKNAGVKVSDFVCPTTL